MCDYRLCFVCVFVIRLCPSLEVVYSGSWVMMACVYAIVSAGLFCFAFYALCFTGKVERVRFARFHFIFFIAISVENGETEWHPKTRIERFRAVLPRQTNPFSTESSIFSGGAKQYSSKKKPALLM